MKWIKIDSNNLPENEVLAACIDDGVIKHTVSGKLMNNPFNEGSVMCDGLAATSLGVTHYINIQDIQF